MGLTFPTCRVHPYRPWLSILVLSVGGCLDPLPCPSGSPSSLDAPTDAGADGHIADTDSTVEESTVEESTVEEVTVYAGDGDVYLPGDLALQRVEVERCASGTPLPLLVVAPEQAGSYPIVLFQHGFMTRNDAYDTILSHVASHGFVVVAPQMYPPGVAALLGNPTAAREAELSAEVLDWFPSGLADVIGYVPAVDRIGLAGHSRGGKVAWLVVSAGAPVRALAGIDPVDGTGGPLGNQPRVVQGEFAFDLPVLVLGAGLSGDCAPEGDNHEQFYAASRSPAWHVVVPGQGHADMLDESEANLASSLCPSGEDRAGMRRLTAGLMVALFRAALQGQEGALAHLEDVSAMPVPVDVEAR